LPGCGVQNERLRTGCAKDSSLKLSYLPIGRLMAANGFAEGEGTLRQNGKPEASGRSGGRRPNILFLLNDHQAYYRHGWDAGPNVSRPHFDRLASEGIFFNRAYTACPLCAPARRTILTGLLPHTHGELNNGTMHPFDRELYLDVLAEKGYRQYYYGKWDAGPGTAFDHHCEGFSYPGYGHPYATPEYAEYLARRGLSGGSRVRWDPSPVPYDLWGVMTSPKETHEAFFLADLACDKLRELAASDGDQPWSLRVDFWGPHQPYIATREFTDLYEPGGIPQYPSFDSDLAGKPELYRFDVLDTLHKDNRLIYPNPLPWSEWQKILARCYAQVTLVDAAGGMILDALDELGLTENTLVVWTTDHGDGVASHGGHWDKSAYPSEEVLRVPLAIRYPGHIEAGQVSEQLVGNIDLAPTLLDAAGTAFGDKAHGTTLMRVCAGETEGWRDDLMLESNGYVQQNYLGRILITDHFKYVSNRGDTDELYDYRKDPYEMANLVHDDACAEVVDEMKARLARWRQQTEDVPSATK